MEEEKVANNLTSAAAFVEGRIQEACDDACSICLEAFCDSDPSTLLTACKHEFHLQCILEWCQRSSQCPMCWQSISLKDPSSQELLDAVEHERNLRMNPPRNTTIFHHPTLGDFELQHLPVNASESELEERIIQHLAAAAAMGRARQLARREVQRNRSSQGRPRFLVFSTHPNEASATSAASSLSQREGSRSPPEVITSGSNSPFMAVGGDSSHLIARPSSAQGEQLVNTASGSSPGAYQHGTSSSNRSPAHTSPNSQDRAGPSELQSFSDSLKSRLSALSTRYKESITKSTRGWKERLFARNSSTPEPNSEARGEVDQRIANDPGIATISRMMDHLQVAEYGRTNTPTASRSEMSSERVCYVQCNFCNTILAVSVPSSSLLSIVTVRCGHCANLLSVNMGGLLQSAVYLQDFQKQQSITEAAMKESGSSSKCNIFHPQEQPKMPPMRPPEKRQRVPSAYNRFIKEEIQRIKASNPEITHREAFSAAAKNWAHLPHIHFGLNKQAKMSHADHAAA